MENRTELFREKRKGIAKTEYMLMERLNDLTEQVEALTKKVDEMGEHLYFFAKYDKEEYKNAFDEQFKESLDELEKIINLDTTKLNIPRALWYEDTDKREPDKEMIYVTPNGTEYIWLDDMWVRI